MEKNSIETLTLISGKTFNDDGRSSDSSRNDSSEDRSSEGVAQHEREGKVLDSGRVEGERADRGGEDSQNFGTKSDRRREEEERGAGRESSRGDGQREGEEDFENSGI